MQYRAIREGGMTRILQIVIHSINKGTRDTQLHPVSLYIAFLARFINTIKTDSMTIIMI